LRLLLMIPYCRFKARWDGDGGRLHLDAESLWPRAQVWPPFCLSQVNVFLRLVYAP
jgi:hypothetical protein